jgi:hypothetical protein
MREKKILQQASNALYATGPKVGQATKIAPPTANVTDGKVPGSAFGAQWQNYIEHYLQKQIEASAQLPFRNFIPFDVGTLAPVTSPLRFCSHPQLGLTLVVGGHVNMVPFISEFQEIADATTTPSISLVPAVGNFAAICVSAVNDPVAPKWIVGGSPTIGANAMFEISLTGVATELTLPTTSAIENMAVDTTTGILYALAGRYVIQRNAGTGAWTIAGDRGVGQYAPDNATSFFAVNNGIAVMAYTTGGVVTLERIVISPFARTIVTIATDSTATKDVRYSPQLGAFLLLTLKALYSFADPAGAINTWPNGSNDPATNATGGILTDTGCITWVGTSRTAYVRSWPGDSAHALHFGPMGSIVSSSTINSVGYDGSAIWLRINDGSSNNRLFRSLRSL